MGRRASAALALAQHAKEASTMKRILLAAVAAVGLVGTTGCCHCNPFACFDGLLGCGCTGGCDGGCGVGCDDCGGGAIGANGPMSDSAYASNGGAPCNGCGNGNGGFLSGLHKNAQPAFQGGPPTGQITYPYYTTRGPRDYLARNPQSIGR